MSLPILWYSTASAILAGISFITEISRGEGVGGPVYCHVNMENKSKIVNMHGNLSADEIILCCEAGGSLSQLCKL
jgi:hypothetical protein